MRTVAIIQARLDSERLPGKALKLIGDRSILEWVVYRTRQIDVDEVVVATTWNRGDLPIVELCHALDVPCFRGSSDDLLTRYLFAAREVHATHILRVTADCPMLDPALNQAILDKLVEWPLDYVASRGWPDGVGQEAFTYKALQRAQFSAREPADREHVVPWMIRHLNCAYIDRTIGKLSVDTPADLKLLRSLYDQQPELWDLVPAG